MYLDNENEDRKDFPQENKHLEAETLRKKSLFGKVSLLHKVCIYTFTVSITIAFFNALNIIH